MESPYRPWIDAACQKIGIESRNLVIGEQTAENYANGAHCISQWFDADEWLEAFLEAWEGTK